MPSETKHLEASADLLVTGCFRSGTTLLDKLLHAHPHMTIASQAYPILFAYAKAAFLEAKGLERRYPLDHLFRESDYTQEDLRGYLDSHTFEEPELAQIFEQLASFETGVWTPEIMDYGQALTPGPFLSLYRQFNSCVRQIFPNEDVCYVGDKEAMVEEYIPLLLERGVRIALIVRDPRDVCASVNFFNESHMGRMRPLLHTLRSWRRSVAYLLAFEGHPGFFWTKYEDLVLKTAETLSRTTAWLQIDAFDEGQFAEGIYDQYGKLWQSNSSFSTASGIDASAIGQHTSRMPQDVIAYIETICYPEMCALGYDFRVVREYDPGHLYSFREPFVVDHPSFSDVPNYSYEKGRLAHEEERVFMLRSAGNLSALELGSWYIHPRVHGILSEALA